MMVMVLMMVIIHGGDRVYGGGDDGNVDDAYCPFARYSVACVSVQAVPTVPKHATNARLLVLVMVLVMANARRCWWYTEHVKC